MEFRLKELVSDRDDLIQALNDRLDAALSKAQKALLALILQRFVDQLDTEAGNIKNTLRNRRLVALLESTFQEFNASNGLTVVESIVDGVGKIIEFNHRYFSTFDKPAKLLPIQAQVTTAINGWLGIEEGTLAKNGYLQKIFQGDGGIVTDIQNIAIKNVITQTGFFETRRALTDLLSDSEAFATNKPREADGTENRLGKFTRYYRNFTYDLFSQVDRTAAKITSDKLVLKYAVYEGGLIDTSREFCIKRNGKVFTTEEIAAFDPPTAKPPNYNPFTDLGGYGCRHHLNYIPKALALSMRPELKEQSE